MNLFCLFLSVTLSLVHVKGMLMVKAVPRIAIIGGGPTGLSSAIALQELGWNNITIVEQRNAKEIDVGKSYTYNIDGRGHRLLKSLSLWKELKHNSIPFISEDAKINIILANGNLQRKSLPVARNSAEGDDRLALPRQALLDIFTSRIDLLNKRSIDKNGYPCISIRYGTVCENIDMTYDTGLFNITLVSKASDNDITAAAFHPVTQTLHCEFLLGCDGINSVVRKWLQTAPTSAFEYSNILDSNFQFPSKEFHGVHSVAAKKKFGLTSYDVDSAGLLYKFLLIRPHSFLPLLGKTGNNPSSSSLSQTDGTTATIPFRPEEFYAIRGVDGTSTIGFLPTKIPDIHAPQAYRTANFIRKPNHPLWQLADAQSVKDYFQKTFPQIDWDTFVTQEELERFAKATPGRFPKPQHVQGMQVVFYGSSKKMSKKQPSAVVALAGDAVHAFPPDLGQGVTSALEDVRILQKSLAEHPDSIERGLRAYESEQLPEAAALCKLVVHGFPDQYKQNHPIKRFLRQGLAGLRLIFSRILPTIVSPPVFFLLQDHSLNYRQVWRRRLESNRNILTGLAVVAALWLTRWFPRWFPAPQEAAQSVASKTMHTLAESALTISSSPK